jgi:hypothetical protein
MSNNQQIQEFWIGSVKYPVWRDKTVVSSHPGNISIIDNPEIDQIKAPLVKTLVDLDAAQRAASPLKSLGHGGQKIRNLEDLGSPVFELLNERAKVMFKIGTGSKTAVVDDCWANVMHQDEWTIPHSHKRSTASIVYSLDPGDEEAFEQEPLNGQLMFSDHRLPQCCPLGPNYVTSFFRPIGNLPSHMVIFPSYLTHLVSPYHGKRPRISIAWNLNGEKISGEVWHADQKH